MSFRTSRVHSCFSQELSEPRPAKCKCRKLVTQAKATEMVRLGEADWLLDFKNVTPDGEASKTWHVVLRGRTSKTPRAHTLEKAHIQRALEKRDYLAQQSWLNDEGQAAKDMESAAMGDQEQMELFELYHDLEIEERYSLFRGMNYKDDKGAALNKLRELKRFSDTFGTVEGPEGKYVADIITGRAHQLKNSVAVDDPYEGRPLFPMIGWDQRTKT